MSNTKVVNGDPAAQVRKMKEAGLIDEYQVVVIPVVLGRGKTMFDGIPEKLNLELINTRQFGNGNVFLRYEPAA